MKKSVRKVVKNLLEQVDSEYFDRLAAISILRDKFSVVRDLPHFSRREELWAEVFNRFKDQSVSVLEFGCWEGYSIKKFAELNSSENSQFFGFDSFEGLPEYWTSHNPKGKFDVQGQLPVTDDQRISFIKGWFQNTLSTFLKDRELHDTLFVHYDADLFSATLYVLLEIDRLKKPYFAVFDEFTGHESQALWRYIQMSGAQIEFMGSVGDRSYPTQVSCKITPVTEYQPQ